MKKIVGVAVAMSGILAMGVGQAWSLSSETTMLLDLLKAKGVITQKDAAEFTKTLESKTADSDDDHRHSVQSLSDRLERIEQKEGAGLAEATSKVKLSGVVEVEMSSGRAKDSAGDKTNSSDISLATAQLNADAEVNQYVNGHLAVLYEEEPGDSSNITLDEAIIGLKGGEEMPVYANAGRMYVPFGHFESHLITDPVTLTLGETNDTAVIAGYANNIVDLNVGAFRGKVKETGKSDHVNSLVASVTLSLPKGSENGLAMTGGVSYLSNLAASDSLEAETTVPGEVIDAAGGVSTFLSVAYAERFFFEAEYLGALENFADGDLSFVDANNRKPQAWNLEAAAKITEKTEVAVRYGGSDKAGNFLADNEYGAAFQYELFDNTNIAIEYLFQKFQDDSDNSQATMQLAVEF